MKKRKKRRIKSGRRQENEITRTEWNRKRRGRQKMRTRKGRM